MGKLIEFFSSSITGNAIGLISLIIGGIGLFITVKTLNSAKKIEKEIVDKNKKAIEKSKFHREKELLLSKLKSTQDAIRKQQRISCNSCSSTITIINDFLKHNSVFHPEDIQILENERKKLNDMIDKCKVSKNESMYKLFNEYDRCVSNIIRIVEKGDYDL